MAGLINAAAFAIISRCLLVCKLLSIMFFCPGGFGDGRNKIFRWCCALGVGDYFVNAKTARETAADYGIGRFQ
jgi:hypothetical protein